jgi:hypothetical protein
VHAWSGQCNKNLGNAFVIVWRIGDEKTIALSQQNTRLRGGSVEKAAPAAPSQSERRNGTPGSVKIRKMNSSGSNKSDELDGKSSKKERKQGIIDLRRVPGVDILGKFVCLVNRQPNRCSVILCVFFFANRVLIANQALIGYCKIIAEINRNRYVMRYRNEPRLTEKGTHDFKVLYVTFSSPRYCSVASVFCCFSSFRSLIMCTCSLPSFP